MRSRYLLQQTDPHPTTAAATAAATATATATAAAAEAEAEAEAAKGRGVCLYRVYLMHLFKEKFLKETINMHANAATRSKKQQSGWRLKAPRRI